MKSVHNKKKCGSTTGSAVVTTVCSTSKVFAAFFLPLASPCSKDQKERYRIKYGNNVIIIVNDHYYTIIRMPIF